MVAVADLVLYKPVTVTETSSNGGRRSTNQVVLGASGNIFPRVTSSARTAGTTRYRKLFLANMAADDSVAWSALVFLGIPSPGGDRFAIAVGEKTDTQANATSTTTPVDWTGTGQLQVALSGSETSIQANMEAADFVFPNGGFIFLSNAFMTSQTVDASVRPGDSVQLSAGTWYKITATSDMEYPKGLYIGDDTVSTFQSGTTNEEFLQLADNLYEDEDIGDGDGSDTDPPLSTLSNATNGICNQRGLRPVVTATCGGVEKTVTVLADGSCSGYCSDGEFNFADGSWTTDIVWTTAPDNGTDITVTYRENCFSYSGTVATVELESGVAVAGAYSTPNTYLAGCVDGDNLTPSVEDWTENAAGSGTYDESTYPLTFFNDGTVEDDWTLTFTGATAFTVSGTYSGSLGAGSISSDFSPTNPDTSQPYFTIDKDGWGGTWQSGDTITFTTHAADVAFWLREIVPALTSESANNLFQLRWYVE